MIDKYKKSVKIMVSAKSPELVKNLFSKIELIKANLDLFHTRT